MSDCVSFMFNNLSKKHQVRVIVQVQWFYSFDDDNNMKKKERNKKITSEIIL